MTIAPRAFTRFALPEIAKTLEVARTQKVDIPEAVLQAVNMKFSEIPKSGSVPWPEELEILNYRSLFNAIAAPVPSSRTIGTGSSVFVEIGQGSRPLFKNLALERFNQALDGGIWEDMVFIDCTIRYKGGPVTLRNVRFINCRFIFEPGTPAKRLSEELLTSSKVSVDIKG